MNRNNVEHFRHWQTIIDANPKRWLSPRKFRGEEHIAECLVIVSINCPSKTNETTLLPSNEQTGSGEDELAEKKIFFVTY